MHNFQLSKGRLLVTVFRWLCRSVGGVTTESLCQKFREILARTSPLPMRISTRLEDTLDRGWEEHTNKRRLFSVWVKGVRMSHLRKVSSLHANQKNSHDER